VIDYTTAKPNAQIKIRNHISQ